MTQIGWSPCSNGTLWTGASPDGAIAHDVAEPAHHGPARETERRQMDRRVDHRIGRRVELEQRMVVGYCLQPSPGAGWSCAGSRRSSPGVVDVVALVVEQLGAVLAPRSANAVSTRAIAASVRDEGTSYRFAPADVAVLPHPRALTAIDDVLTEAGVPHDRGMTWTTDAFFRETRARVPDDVSRAGITVEMEAAAMFAAAAFRGIVYGQLLYAGDDISADEWDHRH